MTYLRFAGKDAAYQKQALIDIVTSNPVLMDLLWKLDKLNLPDWWLVSGAIYNNVWNYLTGRKNMTGVKDLDVFYFDASDLSYDAEDVEIKRASALFDDFVLPVEVENQARVHLWAPEKFGHGFAPLISSLDMLDKFASKTHSVAVRLDESGQLQVFAPFGLDDIFSFRIVPNYALSNRRAHETKATRALGYWPELDVIPWSDSLPFEGEHKCPRG